ncbi:SigE family RNA polymerase sigma factor [Kribbella kalugense]|uniref:RNA polymerase sigma-70 factor (Sigma-E family) n=1 Tax=Kribbella kalugense TaxID=2512221 RepID=A0A4R7ZWT4_9ACTN|nr:SigE family RNA polymerase sigma factor [Kribbella kalugense]TDW22166.1 RNA polymerase sigma-70 factor (sigma-E family) [Kribbella kalugense]
MSFAEFATSRHGALYRYAYLLAGDRGLAEDLVQEALVKTYVGWHRLRDPSNAEAYTRRVITTTAIGWWRRKSWRAELPNGDVPDRPVNPDDVTARVWLWQELQKLPPRQRAALVLRYYEDLTEPQTAEVLGCSVGTVKSQVSDALKKLRTRLGADVVLKAGMTE